MTDRFIITAKYTTQPSFGAQPRKFTRTRSVAADCTLMQADLWAYEPVKADKRTTLDRVTVTPDD